MKFLYSHIQQFRRHSEKGFSAAWFLVVLPVLLGFVGLAVDAGVMFAYYRLGQVTVDGAAYAAATVLDENVFEATNDVVLAPEACATADYYAAANGRGVVSITCSLAGTSVTINGTVTAPTFFMRVFGLGSWVFHPSASAELKYGIAEEGQ